MTTATNDEFAGAGNISVGGDVRGDINQWLTKVGGDLLQIYGDGSGYRDLIVRDEIDPAHVAWLAERFAEPGKFADALGRLRDDEQTVFLAGESGSGRWTAAVCLLAAASGGDRPTIKVIEADEGTQLSLRRIPSGAHVLLDLTGADEQVLAAIEPQLKNFTGTVANAAGRLVVLMSGRESADLQATYHGQIVPLTRPPATEVVRKHLDADGLPGENVVAREQVRELLRLAEVADAARFARLVRAEYRDAREAGVDGEAVLDKAIQRAVDAYGDWTQDLITEYDGTGDGDVERRGLLLTVALLNNSDIEALYQAEQRLFRLAGYTQNKENLLAGKGFAGRLSTLPSATYRGGRAWFNRRAYDESVLRHVWNGYPELRDKLVAWVAEVGESVALSDAEAKGLVDRFAELCASQGTGAPIAQVAKKWAATGKSRQAGLAVRLLTVAALDGRIGPVVHRELNKWAGQKDLPTTLAEVVRTVCVSQFGRAHTDKALTRLGNLADHNDAKVSGGIVAAVRSLVRDNGVFPQALTKLGEWLGGDKDRRKVIAVRILTELTDPETGMLTLEDLDPKQRRDMRALLVRVWGGVLSIDDIAMVEPAVRAWLSAAVARQERRQQMLDVLAEATTANTATTTSTGTLMICANNWLGVSPRYWPSPGADAKVDVYHDLMARINGAGTTPTPPVGTGDG